jgi:hypothetical protein
MKIDKIKIRGEKTTAEAAVESGILQLDSSFLIKGATRGASDVHDVKLNDDSVIELIFEDNTTWFCNQNTLDEVFPEISAQNRSLNEIIELPLVLYGGESERGFIGNILLKIVNVFTKKKIAPGIIRNLAQELEKKTLENQIGLFFLDKGFQLQKFSKQSTTDPYLLFLHGTAASTKASFGGLEGTDIWTHIHQTYDSRVITFQHESLTKGPIENALDLVNALPKNCTIHIVSQSHGGLVGEVLSRFCNTDQNNIGFSAEEISLLRKSKRQKDIDNIELLQDAVAGKRITIKKFIRVACPAGGSTLASERLDHFFNMLFNLIGLTGAAANPIYLIFKSLIGALLESKNDVDILPGVEALSPKSPFIEALTYPGSLIEIDNSLIIISGNCKTKVNFKALLVIASKLFFRHANDLIVDTESMYSGTKRSGNVQYFLDESPDVDHFHYFRNRPTQQALLGALKAVDGQLIPDFKLRQQTLAGAKRGILLDLEGGQIFQDKVTGTRPILVLLPGIMGSNLSQNNKLIWINYIKFLAGELKKISINSKDITAESLVKTSYGKLVRHFSEHYDVVTFPFDWRQQLSTRTNLFKDKIEEILKYKQPIKIIGHSMGGVLVRDFIVYHPATWDKLNTSKDFKLIFLGAPLGGSFRILSVLLGEDDIINKLSKIDIVHTKKELVELFSRLPGILSLLPHSTGNGVDFAKAETWTLMKEGLGKTDWKNPDDADLKNFKAYRDKILSSLSGIDYSNAVYVAGHDKDTKTGYEIIENKNGKELRFLSTTDGDYSVTWETGIPGKMISADSVYYTDVTHGALANEAKLFTGLSEILNYGFTNLLSKTRPAPLTRGQSKIFRSPQVVDFDLSPEGVERTLLGLGDGAVSAQQEAPVKVFVTNGDLKFARYPIVAGHFAKDGILYAEKSIDLHLKKALSHRHHLGLYPGDIGTSEVLFSDGNDFPGTIIIGLGEQGSLTAFQLFLTAEQGITKYLLHLNTLSKNASESKALKNGISSLAIGCGYGGLSIESSVRAILQGAASANVKIQKLYGTQARLIENVEFVEVYSDRALATFYALTKIEKEREVSLPIVVDKKKIFKKPGCRSRIPVDMTEGWWTRINVEFENDTKRKIGDSENVKGVSIVLRKMDFTISTGGASEEKRQLQSTKGILDGLIKEISSEQSWTPVLAKTIFELLIPNDLKHRVKKQNNINWIVDTETASYPWELLQDSTTNAKPLCINAGMIRQLATEDFRINVNLITNNKALVVSDPDLKGFLNQLPGAYNEGMAVSSLLSTNNYETTSIPRGTASEIIQTIFSNEFKIIHLAGHGYFDPKFPEASGMVIGKEIFLSSREISQMSAVPEFIFVNCCFLGKSDGVAENFYHERYRMAANLGVQLIENGAKAVIAAGWEVDDKAALEFTEVFYKTMFEGYSFGDSVKKARNSVYDKFKNSSTWGAYQCYGDPFYRLRSNGDQNEKQQPFVIAEEAEVQLSNLLSDVEMGGVDIEYLSKLSAISEEVDRAGIRNAAITEKEALIYDALYEYDLSVQKFESLLQMENASFTLSAIEDFCQVRARKYVADYLKWPKNVPRLLKKMDAVIKDVQSLLTVGATAERYLLMGNVHRRKALMLQTKNQKINAYVQAAYYYQKANEYKNHLYSAYPFAYWMEIESALVAIGKHEWGKSVKTPKGSYEIPTSKAAQETFAKIRMENPNGNSDNTDYWHMLSNVTLDFGSWLLSPKDNTDALARLNDGYRGIWNKVGSKGKKHAEIDHMNVVLDLLSLGKNVKSKDVNATVKQLKEMLEKLI